MLYEFEDVETGEQIQIDYAIGTAPPLFDRISRDGRALMRVASRVELDVQRDLSRNPGGKLSSQSLPINWPYAKEHDSEGRAVFKDHREAHEAVRRAKDDGEYVQRYDSKWGKN